MVKQNLEKQPIYRQDTTSKPDLIGVKSRRILCAIAARVQGFQWLKWLHLKERTINRGNEEKRIEGLRADSFPK